MLTSGDNPRIKLLRKLVRQKKARSKERAFVVEGAKLVLEAKASGLTILEVFVRADQAGAELLVGDLADLDPESVEAGLFDDCVATQSPQPVVAIVKQPENDWGQVSIVSAGSGNVTSVGHAVVLHEVRDPGNLGTIIRTAEASGARLVVLTGDCVELYSPKAVRSAAGALFRLPIVVEHDVATALADLAAAGWRTCATVVDGADIDTHLEANLANAAIVLGNETHGLPSKVVKACQSRVTIATPGPTESLNLAAAAAVTMFEAYRQQSLQAEAS